MKKRFSLLLAMIFLLSAVPVGLAASAMAFPGGETMPAALDDVNLDTTPAGGSALDDDGDYVTHEQEIPVFGYIGLVDPVYDININVNGVVWWVDQFTHPDVVSPKYTIVNNSEYFSLLVAFKGSTVDDADSVTAADLELYLSGALDFGDGHNLAGDVTINGMYNKLLEEGTPWEYGFRGTYTPALPKNALMPEYTMTLIFDIAEPGVAIENQQISGVDGALIDNTDTSY